MKISINKLQQFPRILFTITLFSILAACGGGSTTPDTPTAPTISTDAKLSSLEISAGSLSPAFAGDVTAYTLSAGTTTATTTTVTPTVSDTKATVAVNDIMTNSGSASASIDLDAGDNTITVKVTAEDKSTKTYSITVTRIAVSSNDASLSNILVSAGSLSPAFTSDTLDYTIDTKASVTTVTPYVSQANATVTVNDTTTDSGSASATIDLTVGDNPITIIVTAADATTQTYNIKITRIALSTDTSLSGLALSAGSLNPAFDSNILDYTIDTKVSVTTVTPTVSDVNATVTVNGTATDSGSASASINLTIGENTITLIVTAEDKSTKTYNIKVTSIDAIADTSLSSLVLSAGSLSPTFDSKVTDYTVTTTAETTTVTPTVNDANATVTVNDITTDSGKASAPMDLKVGDNTITLIVTAEDKSTTTYNITVTRAAVPTDASLSNLVPSASSLSPKFASDILQYELLTEQEKITVTPTVSQATATVKVNDTATKSGEASQSIDLTVGENIITLIVTAADGKTIKTYKITVTRIDLTTNASLRSLTLSSGTLSPDFSSKVTDYTVTTTAETITLTPTVDFNTATVKVNDTATKSGEASQSIDLTVGENTITLIVTAEDKSTTTYNITVTRAAVPTDASLSNLVPSASSLSPKFASGILQYELLTEQEKITVTPTVSQATATVKVNDTATKSGEASQSIDLTVGENIITLIVTAADGKTTKTYKITVTRIDLTTNASLRSLTLSSGTLSPDFSSKVTDYTATITTETITLTPTVDFNKATVKVNDTATDSGSASAPITLAAGDNTITLIVTAADKSTTKTYSIKVKRIANVEFTNPKAADAANHKFGEKVVQLSNGNIVVHAPGYGTDKGAVHFYKPTSSTAVASFYGTNDADQVGSGGIIALANDNFLIVSPFEDKEALYSAGSVRLVNGTTGNIIKTITGNSKNDRLAIEGITLLNDNQFVITSSYYQNDNSNAGSVLVIDDKGDTVKALYGNKFGITHLGDQGVTALSNNNFVITSTFYTHNGHANAGIVQLVDSKGEVIASITGQGQKANEFFGGNDITPLKDGNFLIATQTHDASADLTNAGSIHLINGADGTQIGTPLIGDKKDGYLGKTSGGEAATTTITPLGNNNYVVLHHTADSATVTNAGSIRLFNGVSGNEIVFAATATATATGTPVFGSYADDFVKQDSFMTKITVLENHNFVVTAPNSDKQGVRSVGSIRLMNGFSGAQLGVQEGNNSFDRLGNGDVIELSNGKYVIASSYNSNDVKSFNGSVSIFNNKGEALEPLVGSQSSDFLGDGGLTALGNDKFVIASTRIERNSLGGAGSIQLVDASGAIDTQVIKEISGDDANDFIFSSVTQLNNNNFVFALPWDDVTVDGTNKIVDAGSVQVVNGSTGVADNKILGLKKDDMKSAQMIKPATGNYFILSQPLADDNDKVDVGRVRLIVPTFPAN